MKKILTVMLLFCLLMFSIVAFERSSFADLAKRPTFEIGLEFSSYPAIDAKFNGYGLFGLAIKSELPFYRGNFLADATIGNCFKVFAGYKFELK